LRRGSTTPPRSSGADRALGRRQAIALRGPLGHAKIVQNVISITPIILTGEQCPDRRRPRRAGAKP
jgi:hypothetical protein